MEKSQSYKKQLQPKSNPTPDVLQKQRIVALQQDICNSDIWIHITNEHSHVRQHVNCTTVDCISRIFNEDKDNISKFTSADAVLDEIEGALMLHADGIILWLDDAKDDKLVIDEMFLRDDDEKPLGHLYHRDQKSEYLTEYNTDAYRIILERDPAMKHGFAVITAYPIIADHYANMTPTNRDLTPFVQQTDAYKRATPIKQTYMEFCANPNRPNLFMRYAEPDSGYDESLKIKIPSKTNETDKHIIHVKTNKIELHTIRNRKTIQSEYSETAKYVNLLEQSVHDKFATDYPLETDYIDAFYHTVQSKINPSKQPTRTNLKEVPTTIIENTNNCEKQLPEL